MRNSVLIAGAGQLGSRYLQGLSKLTMPTDIFVFDVSPHSLLVCEQRWNEMKPAETHDVSYLSSLEDLSSTMDLAIVAATADVRAELVKQIQKQADVKYWVLEKVLAQSVGEISELLNSLKDRQSWVNTPMYLWPLYYKLRDLYPVGVPIEANFEGFNGLTCNAIHYVDFVARWNGARVNHLDISGLQTDWYPAKRNRFYEIDGEIRASFSDGSFLRLYSDRNNLGYKVKLKIDGEEWNVSESEGLARSSDNRVVLGGIEFQSQMTAPLVQAIFSGAPCGLPTLAESAQQHTLFVGNLLDHWNQNMPDRVERLPIT
jgi:hypothetical protein